MRERLGQGGWSCRVEKELSDSAQLTTQLLVAFRQRGQSGYDCGLLDGFTRRVIVVNWPSALYSKSTRLLATVMPPLPV